MRGLAEHQLEAMERPLNLILKYYVKSDWSRETIVIRWKNSNVNSIRCPHRFDSGHSIEVSYRQSKTKLSSIQKVMIKKRVAKKSGLN